MLPRKCRCIHTTLTKQIFFIIIDFTRKDETLFDKRRQYTLYPKAFVSLEINVSTISIEKKEIICLLHNFITIFFYDYKQGDIHHPRYIFFFQKLIFPKVAKERDLGVKDLFSVSCWAVDSEVPPDYLHLSGVFLIMILNLTHVHTVSSCEISLKISLLPSFISEITIEPWDLK